MKSSGSNNPARFKALLARAIISLMPLLPGLACAGTAPGVFHMLRPGVTGAEVQAALDDLPDAGGIVILPPGVVTLTQPIVIRRSWQILRGAGTNTVLRVADGANCPALIMGEPVNHPGYDVMHAGVESLFIDGNRHAQQRELWQEHGEGSEIRNNGITVQRVRDSVIENVVTARCRSGGLVTTLGVHGLVVRGLESYDNQYDGLACYATTASQFVDLNLHDNPCAGISLDWNFSGNTVSNAVLTDNDLGIFMRDSRGNRFLNVSIHKSRNHGVFMAQTETAKWTACVNNSFTNLQATNCGGAAFRVNDASCRNNIITSAKFENNQHGDLSLAQPKLIVLQ